MRRYLLLLLLLLTACGQIPSPAPTPVDAGTPATCTTPTPAGTILAAVPGSAQQLPACLDGLTGVLLTVTPPPGLRAGVDYDAIVVAGTKTHIHSDLFWLAPVTPTSVAPFNVLALFAPPYEPYQGEFAVVVYLQTAQSQTVGQRSPVAEMVVSVDQIVPSALTIPAP